MSNFKEKRKLKELKSEQSEPIEKKEQPKTILRTVLEADNKSKTKEIDLQSELEKIRDLSHPELANHPVVLAELRKRKVKEGFTFTGFTVEKEVQNLFSITVDKNGRKANHLYALFMKKYIADPKAVHAFLDL